MDIDIAETALSCSSSPLHISCLRSFLKLHGSVEASSLAAAALPPDLIFAAAEESEGERQQQENDDSNDTDPEISFVFNQSFCSAAGAAAGCVIPRYPLVYAGATESNISDAFGGDKCAEAAADHWLQEQARVVRNHNIGCIRPRTNTLGILPMHSTGQLRDGVCSLPIVLRGSAHHVVSTAKFEANA